MATLTQSFLQGEVIEGKYTLVRYLGGSAHSAVFLTQYGSVHPKNAAIKLVPAPPGNAEARLSRWRLAANLSHPHLMRILDLGRCEVENAPMLYVLSELADENLAQIIPERPLTPEEARDMLGSLLDALVFLHSRGFVHGHIRPSNIMAVGEDLKLASDGICRLGEAIENGNGASAYDLPEGNRGGASKAGDIWSLGVTLVETLTQQAPEWNASDRRDPVAPETMPPPFPEIVRHCLRRDPKSRWPADTIQAHVPRTVSAPVRVAAREPEPVPERAKTPARGMGGNFVGKGPALVAAASAAARDLRAKWPAIRAAADSGVRRLREKWAALQPAVRAAAQWLDARKYAAGAVVAVLAIVLLGVKLIGRHTAAPPVVTPHEAAASAPVQPGPARTRNRAGLTASARKIRTPRAERPAVAETKRFSPPPAAAGRAAAPANAAPSTTASTDSPARTARRAPATSASAVVPGHVLQRVLPDVPREASNTIWGTVRVVVRVGVDTAGNVTQAELQSRGPSRYFARLSLEAARKWRFAAPVQNGAPVASAWLLHFGYRHDGISVDPSEIQP